MTGAADPGERDLRAAEYVLGTLPAADRTAFELERTVDPDSDRAVRAWERRLAPLALGAAPQVPAERVWAAIVRALPPRVPLAANDDRVAGLRRQVRRWRIVATGAGLLAAGLALFVAIGLRRAEDVPGARYLAVVQGGGALPAMVVRIDTAAGTAEVRPVGAEAPAGKSLQLWYVGAGAAPKPLGLVGTAATRVALPAGAGADGVIAVSVEPPGGSPSGAPTGPVVYTGTLLRD